MLETGNHLVKDGGSKTTSEWSALSGLDEMIEIALHGLKDKVELLGVGLEEEVV